MNALIASALAAAVTALVLARLRVVAVRIGLADEPSARKAHAGSVPLVGGLAMLCGLVLGALLLEQTLTPFRPFFAGVTILVAVGVLDDMHELSSNARFGAQILAAALMAWWGGIVLANLGALRPDGSAFTLGVWAVPFTVFATVGVINALNMADGLDGLAGGLALVAMVGLLVVAVDTQRWSEARLLAVLVAVVIAFLAFNLRLPGRSQGLVFMGDAGSMLLGFAITWFFVGMSQGAQRAMPPVLALYLLLVPLYDTVWLLIYRPLTRRSPTAPGSEHLHHVLQMAGLGVNGTVAVIWAIAVLAAGVGLAGYRLGWPENLMFHGFLAVFAAYCLVMVLAWRFNRLLVWPLDRRLLPGDRRTGPEQRTRDRRSGVERRSEGDRRHAGSD